MHDFFFCFNVGASQNTHIKPMQTQKEHEKSPQEGPSPNLKPEPQNCDGNRLTNMHRAAHKSRI